MLAQHKIPCQLSRGFLCLLFICMHIMLLRILFSLIPHGYATWKHATMTGISSIQANFILCDLVLVLLTATASVFTSSLLSGAVRSIRTGHTLVSTSYLSMSSCSNRTNNAAWLVFLTYHKKTTEPKNSKRGFFVWINVLYFGSCTYILSHTYTSCTLQEDKCSKSISANTSCLKQTMFELKSNCTL